MASTWFYFVGERMKRTTHKAVEQSKPVNEQMRPEMFELQRE